ncbi:hypothetical protein U5O48_004399 [Cronobacter turicensis]|nr:hypothetical protein [Cronobacter turicensis]
MSYQAVVTTFDPEIGSHVDGLLYQMFATEAEAAEHGRKSSLEMQQCFVDAGQCFIVSYRTVEVPGAEVIPFRRA